MTEANKPADQGTPTRSVRRGSVRLTADGVSRRSLFQTALAGAGLTAGALFAGPAFARTPFFEPGAAPQRAPGQPKIAREFDDPYLELLRLLRESSEIEHGLMLQYLYAAFSLRPKYRALRGEGMPSANDLMGVAIQEMQHLSAVNRMMVALGAAPNLTPQDFPYEPDIYPFEFTLEPLTKASLAKYIYAESPANAFSDFRPPEVGLEIERILGRSVRPNHVGSLYDAILTALGELQADARKQPLARDFDFAAWKTTMTRIKGEGEDDHFGFFRRVFTANHVAFGLRTDVWSLPPADPDYPSLPLPKNPSAFAGDPNQIQDPKTLQLAWLGNLHYWVVLALLTHGYRYDSPAFIALAERHMQGPVLATATALAARGAGMPFEQLNLGYAPGLDNPQSVYFLLRLLGETHNAEVALAKGNLPGDFPTGVTTGTLAELNDLWSAAQKVQTYRLRG